MTIRRPGMLTAGAHAAPPRRANAPADERMQIGLVCVGFVAAVTLFARASVLPAGLASPLVWPGVVLVGLVVSLYWYVRGNSLSDPVRNRLSLAASMGLLWFLGLRAMAEAAGVNETLQLGPPVPVALLCAAQLMLTWRHFWPVVVVGATLTAVGSSGSANSTDVPQALAGAVILASIAVRWMVGRDAVRRQEAADRERLTQTELVGAVNKLRASELRANRTRALIEQVTAGMPLGVLVNDYETDEVVYSNGRCKEIWRYEESAESDADPGAQPFSEAVKRSAEKLVDPQPFLNLHKSLANDRSSELREMELQLKDGRT